MKCSGELVYAPEMRFGLYGDAICVWEMDVSGRKVRCEAHGTLAEEIAEAVYPRGGFMIQPSDRVAVRGEMTMHRLKGGRSYSYLRVSEFVYRDRAEQIHHIREELTP